MAIRISTVRRSAATSSVTSRPAAPRIRARRPIKSAYRSRCRSIPAAALPRACVSACICTVPHASDSSAPTAKASGPRATRISACMSEISRVKALRQASRVQPHGAAGDRGRLRSRHAHHGRRTRSPGVSCSTRRRTTRAAATTTSSTCCTLQLATGTLDRADLDEINSFLKERLLSK